MDTIDDWKVRLFCFDLYFNISTVLRNNNVSSIAVYGAGKQGRFLIDRILREKTIDIVCVIDQNPDVQFPYSIPLVEPYNRPMPEKVDLVIATPNSLINDFSTRHKIREWSRSEVIHIEEIIGNVNHYELARKTVAHVKSCGASLFLLDYTGLRGVIDQEQSLSTQEKAYINLNYHYKCTLMRMRTDNDYFRMMYGDLKGFGVELLNSLFNLPPIFTDSEGIKRVANHQSRYLNIVNHKRVTTDNPDNYSTKIHIFGNCNAISMYAPDDMTIASQLQRIINSNPLGAKKILVENNANWSSASNSMRQICGIKFRPGDVVILLNEFRTVFSKYWGDRSALRYFNITYATDRPHRFGEIFLDTYHLTHRGYTLLAEEIYKILQNEYNSGLNGYSTPVGSDNLRFEVAPSLGSSEDDNFDYNAIPADLKKYLHNLEEYVHLRGGVNGSIVMNCNPFTKGHRYLIEQALKQCDFLYVFVVEEDKSYFSRDLRVRMVQEGTKNLERLAIIPSGKFILSNETLPEYFTKESKRNISIDASKDLNIFGSHICPLLRIQKRFVGHEPICAVTDQYNQAMLKILPRYGVDVIVIKRKQVGAVTISASLVREMIEKNDTAGMLKLIPKSTYEILRLNGYIK